MSLLGSGAGMNGDTLLFVVLWLTFAFTGYRISVRHRLQRGVTPWGFPSIVWALICLAIGPIGILVEFFAGVTTRPPHHSQVPATAGPANLTVTVESTPHPPGPPSVGQSPVSRLSPPRDASGAVSPFGWYPDVLHRHDYRYFDGKQWSDQVADGGVVSSDPLP